MGLRLGASTKNAKIMRSNLCNFDLLAKFQEFNKTEISKYQEAKDLNWKYQEAKKEFEKLLGVWTDKAFKSQYNQFNIYSNQ